MYPFESEEPRHLGVPQSTPTEVLLREQAYALFYINGYGNAQVFYGGSLHQKVRERLAPLGVVRGFNYKRMAIYLVRLSKEIYKRQLAALE